MTREPPAPPPYDDRVGSDPRVGSEVGVGSAIGVDSDLGVVSALGVDDVHVWRVSLSVSRERMALLARTLSPDELLRARRFRSARDARRFVVARGVLRLLLGHYAGREPRSIAFRYGHAGKPGLAASAGDARLGFNLAHSGSCALVAVARRRRVGIDLEAVRELPELDGIVQRHFSAREGRELRALAPDRRREAFFRGWARKEAVAKAVGDGLHHGFERIEVPLAPMVRPTVVTVPGIGRAASFVLQQVPAGLGFAAALVVETSGDRRLRTTFHEFGAGWTFGRHGDRALEGRTAKGDEA